MKIIPEHYNIMLDAMRAVVESLGGSLKVKEQRQTHNATENRMLVELWAIAERNLLYDDQHPCFRDGYWVRVHPRNGFNPYDYGYNDIHILTALKAIGKELGIL